MPAEWEPHRATWISWPHHEPDWPGKLGPIPWVYAEIARTLANHETVEILCHNSDVRDAAQSALEAHGVRRDRVRLHIVPTDRVWLRDSAPTGVHDAAGDVVLLSWGFNAWAKYDNWRLDAKVAGPIASGSGSRLEQPRRADNGRPIVLEGGGIDVNGQGLLLVTEEWLLSDVQVRNPGLTRADYEAIFQKWLGVSAYAVAWRRLRRRRHARAYRRHREVRQRRHDRPRRRGGSERRQSRTLDRQSAAAGARVQRSCRRASSRRPAPVSAPGDDEWRAAAGQLREFLHRQRRRDRADVQRRQRSHRAQPPSRSSFPAHEVIGIHALDLVWGLGTLHCLTQQEPAPRRP